MKGEEEMVRIRPESFFRTVFGEGESSDLTSVTREVCHIALFLQVPDLEDPGVVRGEVNRQDAQHRGRVKTRVG